MKKKTIPKSDRPKKKKIKIKNNINKDHKKKCVKLSSIWTCAIGKMGGREEREKKKKKIKISVLFTKFR